MKCCPVCKKELYIDFDDVYDGLGEFLVNVGLKDVGIITSGVGKGILCPTCKSPLWAPIRGDPVVAIIIIYNRDVVNFKNSIR